MKTKCPSPIEFETYLSNTGSKEFMNAFESHLHQCGFCSDAVQGYQQNNLIRVTKHSKHLMHSFNQKSPIPAIRLKTLAYAASIAVLCTLSILYMNDHFKSTFLSENFITNESIKIPNPMPPNEMKKLKNTSEEQYWYLGQNQMIAVNDAILASSELEKAMHHSTTNHAIIVEVQNQDNQFSIQMIEKLKKNQDAPVFTITTRKDSSPFKKTEKL